MTLCTRCGEVEVPAPESIEEDPLCLDCIKALIKEVCDRSMGALTFVR